MRRLSAAPRPETERARTVAGRALSGWCGREDSNFHGLPHSDLNAARLPVPPRPLEKRPHVTNRPPACNAMRSAPRPDSAAPECAAQLVLGCLQYPPPRGGEAVAGPVDVEARPP